jgi:predicted RNase H-like HicB family nuclease
MKLYHVQVEQDEDWLVGRVLEREGVTTQGRSLDELVFMLRDAISLMWNEKNVHLELIVPGGTRTRFGHKPTRKVARRRSSKVAA